MSRIQGIGGLGVFRGSRRFVGSGGKDFRDFTSVGMFRVHFPKFELVSTLAYLTLGKVRLGFYPFIKTS